MLKTSLTLGRSHAYFWATAQSIRATVVSICQRNASISLTLSYFMCPLSHLPLRLVPGLSVNKSAISTLAQHHYFPCCRSNPPTRVYFLHPCHTRPHCCPPNQTLRSPLLLFLLHPTLINLQAIPNPF